MSTKTGAVACSSKQTQLGEGVRLDAHRGEMLGVDILAGRVARARIADDGSLAYVREYQLPSTVGRSPPTRATAAGCSAPAAASSTSPSTGPIGPSPSLPRRHPDERRRLRPPGPVLGRALADDHHEGGGGSTGSTRPAAPN